MRKLRAPRERVAPRSLSSRRLVATLAVLALTALVATAVAALLAVGCGSQVKSPREQFAKILGHPPQGLAASIANKGTIYVADDADYSPQSFMDEESQQLAGFDVDVAYKVGEILKLKVEIVNPNWDAVASGLAGDRFDVSIGSLTVTADRKKAMAFTEPYTYTTAAVVVKKGGEKISAADQLKGKTIGVAAQSTFQLWLQEQRGVSVRVYDSDSAALKGLQRGEVAGVLTDDLTVAAAIAAGAPLESSGTPLFYEAQAFATRLDQPDLVAVLNHAIAEMRDDGSLSEMSKKWYKGVDITRAPASGVPRYDR